MTGHIRNAERQLSGFKVVPTVWKHGSCFAGQPVSSSRNNQSWHPTNNDELDNLMEQFDVDYYKTRVDKFNKGIKLTFDGKAGHRLADGILKKMENR